MDLGSIVVLLKLFEGAGLTKISRPPSSKAGLRPDCGPGKKGNTAERPMGLRTDV